MSVLPQFIPHGKPGQSAEAYQQGRDAAESWMNQAQNRRLGQQQEELNRQKMIEYEIMRPLKDAETKAKMVKAKMDYDSALKMQQASEGYSAMVGTARERFIAINKTEDPKIRAQGAIEWLGNYSQLAGIDEYKQEFDDFSNLMATNLQGFAVIGGAEQRMFDAMTIGMSPEDKLKARRLYLKLDAPPSGAAIQYKLVPGADGSTSLIAVDPRAVGAHVIGGGQIYGSGVVPPPPPGSPATQAGGKPPDMSVFKGQSTEAEAAAKARGAGDVEYQQKLRATKPKRMMALQNAEALTNQLTSDLGDLIGRVTVLTTGPGGVVLDKFPGTSARDLKANLDSIKANIGFQALQAMRDSSPTGGALGQVSDAENKLLQARFGALEIGQSPSQLLSNLKKVRGRIEQNFGISRSAFEHEYKEEDVPESGPVSEAEKIFNELKARVKGGK